MRAIAAGVVSITTSSEVTLVDASGTGGAFELHLDANARTTSDAFVLRLYEKVEGSTGTERLAAEATLTGAATAEKVNILGPFGFLYGARSAFAWTVGATTAGRLVPWSLRRVDI